MQGRASISIPPSCRGIWVMYKWEMGKGWVGWVFYKVQGTFLCPLLDAKWMLVPVRVIIALSLHCFRSWVALREGGVGYLHYTREERQAGRPLRAADGGCASWAARHSSGWMARTVFQGCLPYAGRVCVFPRGCAVLRLLILQPRALWLHMASLRVVCFLCFFVFFLVSLFLFWFLQDGMTTSREVAHNS